MIARAVPTIVGLVFWALVGCGEAPFAVTSHPPRNLGLSGQMGANGIATGSDSAAGLTDQVGNESGGHTRDGTGEGSDDGSGEAVVGSGGTGRSLKLVLDESEQASLVHAMQAAARGHEIKNPPRAVSAADGGMRWTDMEAAVGAACDDAEMAVVRSVSTGDPVARWEFTLQTIEDWPGILVVERRPTPVVYEATTSIGRFPELSDRRARAETLLEALREQLLKYGRRAK